MTLFEKANDRLELLQSMMERTGSRVDADLSHSGAANIRAAVVSCLACKDAENCRQWLKEVEGEVAPPDFCANAGRLKRMQ